MTLFDNVPALLPDLSNLHEVFGFIDFRLFRCPSKFNALEKHKQLVKISDLTPQKWYAVRVPTPMRFSPYRWWTVYWTGTEFITVNKTFNITSEYRFELCQHAGDELWVIPFKDGFAQPLPEDICLNASERGVDASLLVIQKEKGPTRDIGLSSFPVIEFSTVQQRGLDLHVNHFETFSREIGETWSLQEKTKGYDPDAVGYVDRTDTRCDAPKKLTSRQKARRLAKRKAAKQARKRA